ncbi:hypothetical protein GH808_06275 [Acetobacterium fimetarium]|uniref:Uncharacterized protein n=1 Tax=Acetobacterium fimetarium TaxID=52691 RepID=A0ABR6WTV2_9FIRM|nr:hypothetical protein [Acetobacterium fimetarium]MBC3804042.1 hypothetical protein [Acetobacterium fimetarium]
MDRICKYYWEARRALEEHYFKRKYFNCMPKIYYDQRHDAYVNPKIITERGCAEYVCSESVCYGPIYHYNINGSETHEHTIAAVFIDAYNDAEIFSLSEEHIEQYSKQELVMIYKLVKQGTEDRLSYEGEK